MQRLHTYPDIRAMFRRLLIATVTGVLAALAVAVFRHSSTRVMSIGSYITVNSRPVLRSAHASSSDLPQLSERSAAGAQ